MSYSSQHGVKICLQELTDTLKVGGDVQFCATTLARDALSKENPEAVGRICSVALQLTLHQAANVFYRVEQELLNLPYSLFQPLAAQYWGDTESASKFGQALLDLPGCCQNEDFDAKAMRLAHSWACFCDGALGLALQQGLDGMHLVCSDVERDHRQDRVLARPFQSSLPVMLDTLARSAGIRALAREHVRRGNRVPTQYVTSAVMEEHGVDTARNRCKAKREARYRNHAPRPVKFVAFNMYISDAHSVWEQEQPVRDQQEPVGKRRRREATVSRYAARSNGWPEKKAELTRLWHADNELQQWWVGQAELARAQDH